MSRSASVPAATKCTCVWKASYRIKGSKAIEERKGNYKVNGTIRHFMRKDGVEGKGGDGGGDRKIQEGRLYLLKSQSLCMNKAQQRKLRPEIEIQGNSEKSAEYLNSSCEMEPRGSERNVQRRC